MANEPKALKGWTKAQRLNNLFDITADAAGLRPDRKGNYDPWEFIGRIKALGATESALGGTSAKDAKDALRVVLNIDAEFRALYDGHALELDPDKAVGQMHDVFSLAGYGKSIGQILYGLSLPAEPAKARASIEEALGKARDYQKLSERVKGLSANEAKLTVRAETGEKFFNAVAAAYKGSTGQELGADAEAKVTEFFGLAKQKMGEQKRLDEILGAPAALKESIKVALDSYKNLHVDDRLLCENTFRVIDGYMANRQEIPVGKAAELENRMVAEAAAGIGEIMSAVTEDFALKDRPGPDFRDQLVFYAFAYMEAAGKLGVGTKKNAAALNKVCGSYMKKFIIGQMVLSLPKLEEAASMDRAALKALSGDEVSNITRIYEGCQAMLCDRYAKEAPGLAAVGEVKNYVEGQYNTFRTNYEAATKAVAKTGRGRPAGTRR